MEKTLLLAALNKDHMFDNDVSLMNLAETLQDNIYEIEYIVLNYYYTQNYEYNLVHVFKPEELKNTTTYIRPNQTYNLGIDLWDWDFSANCFVNEAQLIVPKEDRAYNLNATVDMENGLIQVQYVPSLLMLDTEAKGERIIPDDLFIGTHAFIVIDIAEPTNLSEEL